MRNILAKAGAVVTTVSLLTASIMPVFADTATNDTTGADSLNSTSVKNENNVVVENVNDAYIRNEVKTVSNTGENFASKNTMGGMIQTGDANTQVAILNNANINTTLIDLGRNGESNIAGNSITGAESDNFAEILNSNKVNVRNDNTAVVCNSVEAKSNTGGNVADKNTDGLGGVVQTGDADTSVSIANRVNDSATSVAGLANFGSNVVGNSITGADSLNSAKIGNLNDVAVENVSDGFVRNRVRAVSTSGENFASKNTMGGMIQTGDTFVDLEILSDVNIVTTFVENGMAGFSSTSGNSITGGQSDNFTELLNRNVFKVLNYNNKGESADADDYCGDPCKDPKCCPAGVSGDYLECCKGIRWGVENIDEDFANTGGNVADKNTYPSSIATGIAEIGKYIRVCLNDTLTSIGEAISF